MTTGLSLKVLILVPIRARLVCVRLILLLTSVIEPRLIGKSRTVLIESGSWIELKWLISIS